MKKLILFFTFFYLIANAEYSDRIRVNSCDLDVIVMETQAELAQGLLNYDSKNFPSSGMLFKINKSGRKIFHTQGMKMPIYIMGVHKNSDGYSVVGDVYFAPPGLSQIVLFGTDVLEIPAEIYQIHYRQCINTREEILTK